MACSVLEAVCLSRQEQSERSHTSHSGDAPTSSFPDHKARSRHISTLVLKTRWVPGGPLVLSLPLKSENADSDGSKGIPISNSRGKSNLSSSREQKARHFSFAPCVLSTGVGSEGTAHIWGGLPTSIRKTMTIPQVRLQSR